MDTIPVAANQSLFFGTTPAFDFMLMDKRFMLCFRFLSPDQFYRATFVGISGRAETLFMFP